MKTKKITKAIESGIEFLISQQKKDGSFLSYSSSYEQDFTNPFVYNTNFLNSIILLESNFLDNKKLLLLRKKLAKFLLLQKSDSWSWNYWTKSSKEVNIFSYPDDLDDTFYALSALYLYDKKIINGEVFAHIVKILTAAEKREGGPYKTWLIKKDISKKWSDVDFAVNCNIYYFLHLHGIDLPNLMNYFETKLKQRKTISSYYPSFYTPLYFISRFYSGKYKKIIAETILQQRNEKYFWSNPLNTSLALLTLLNIDYPIEKIEESTNYLLRLQRSGGWPAYGFCIDPSRNGKKYFAGSEALTTVFCLNILQRYKQIIGNKNGNLANDEELLKSKIKKNILAIFISQNKKTYLKIKNILEQIMHKDEENQISLIAYYFLNSCNLKNKSINKNLIIKLGVANVLGWIAYSIYDEFLDEEGDPSLLSIANISLRQLTLIFDTFPAKTKSIRELFHDLLDKIDEANSWELENCRIKKNINKLPKYKNFDYIANRSIGLAAGPIAILLLLGYKRESKEFKNIYSFFKNFIIAKQLNDDGHDWERDYAKGHMTPVVALILQKAREKNIKLTNKNLKDLFWREIINDVCSLIYKHVRKAKISLHKSEVIVNFDKLELFLDHHKKGADIAIEEQAKIIAFLKTYK